MKIGEDRRGEERVVCLSKRNAPHFINRKYENNVDKYIYLSDLISTKKHKLHKGMCHCTALNEIVQLFIFLCLAPLLYIHWLVEEMAESRLKAEAK